MASLTSSLKLDRYSKQNPWYYQNLTNHLAPDSRKLLEEYSNILPKDVESHVYKLRDTLWSQAPYPCIGEFKFLTLNLRKHPKYTHLLSLMQPSASQPGPFLLDLGCCVAQELRSLAHAGIPSSNLYGSDLNPKYLTTSYDLFNDASTFTGTLVPANIFSPTLFEDKFKGWQEKFKVIHAGLFLHLFDREQQLEVCARILKMLEVGKGSMFLGEMVGCRGGGERGPKAKGFWKKKEERRQFLHDEESFAAMWEDVAEATGTKGCWKVESQFRERAKGAGDGDGGSKGCAFFTGVGIGWITFSCERV
ncbi:hypothetical protein L207DRAFT_591559 [Hyaloscypha variabilis F]|uniref:Methyltransferase domain-containing protein n=1 Tax=Hyaloscypha variabilis (strain UAMH 11265 / GT02V1 / F) TaxID=1149755 RepID=A0A2J6QZC7_HYAVF|nr:hypothetical protein L207DRAFT_591559 [Hyaloscypha variabilis F]